MSLMVFHCTARQNTTGHRTMAKKKGGHNRSLDPDSLLTMLILKTTGRNGYDERKVPKTLNLPKFKNLTRKNEDKVL